MFRNIKSRVEESKRLDDLKGQFQLAVELGDRKLYTEAEYLHRQTWQARQDILGREESATLKSQYYLAWTLNQLKRYEEAETLHRQTWHTRQRLLGQDDPDTLLSQYQLAWTLGQLQRYGEAETLNRQTWHTRQRVLGPEDPGTLRSQFELAWTLGQLKRYEEGETLHRQTWHTRQRVLGPEDPGTLWSQHNLACMLGQLKRYEEAETLHRQTWHTRQRVLGPEDPETLWSQHNLACILGQLKRYEEAETLHRQTWHTRQRVLGPEDPDTLWSQHNLACMLGQLKRYEEAETLDRQTWQTRQRVLGEGSFETLQSLINLSYVVFCLEKYALALELGQNVLPKITALPSREREEIEWIAKSNLAGFLYENGHDHEAEKMFYDVIQTGTTDDAEEESITRFCHAVVSASNQSLNSSLPAIDAALVQSERFPSGRRLLETIDHLSAGHKSSSLPGLRDMFSQETSSFVTCQESKTFLEDLVSQAEPSVTSVETVISTIRNDDVIPTILELDIYYAVPNQTCFITRDGHLDTKASADYISSDLAELLGHRMDTYKGGQISTAAGAIKPIGQISLFLEWQKSSKLRKRTFLVVRDLLFDIILGIGFITEFEVYSIGNILLVMALSPLRKDEKKELQTRAAQNRKRRDAEERLEEEQNRSRRKEKLLAKESKGSALNSASGQRNVTGN